ncbi:MAG: c-type cytochrome biogenesis protein CcmI [Gemmatimonadota bacterium]|nr:c-type cytochrome biogenesis protein CcmI [Gemmatimonadota bacterium]
MITPWVLGTVLALVALAFVLYPLFSGQPEHGDRTSKAARGAESPSTIAVAALREVEFDRATGKLSDSDYAALKSQYTREALTAMRAEETGGDSSDSMPEDEAEAAILRYRVLGVACDSCGPRPELGAKFCSSCGKRLAAFPTVRRASGADDRSA